MKSISIFFEVDFYFSNHNTFVVKTMTLKFLR